MGLSDTGDGTHNLCKSSSVQFCVRISKFALSWQHGSDTGTDVNDILKFADPENPQLVKQFGTLSPIAAV